MERREKEKHTEKQRIRQTERRSEIGIMQVGRETDRRRWHLRAQISRPFNSDLRTVTNACMQFKPRQSFKTFIFNFLPFYLFIVFKNFFKAMVWWFGNGVGLSQLLSFIDYTLKLVRSESWTNFTCFFCTNSIRKCWTESFVQTFYDKINANRQCMTR